ncbi:MAG: hypothetical protein JXR52_08180 [Bacteroidales bacterium]|nr:hypothetical protein [Bacteroidales bacterium]MBN2698788.1 hypothetical protein [Bacteroidales bacterium]
MKKFFLILVSMVMMSGCHDQELDILEGEINLSSQLFGVGSYYLYGYSYGEADYIKYSFPFSGSVVPDLINIPFKNPDGTISASGFNAPSGKNGFSLLGSFSSLDAAREFYRDYKNVEPGLEFIVDSDTVKLYQVWLQKTQYDHFAKLLIMDINFFDGGLGEDYIVANIEYTYQNDGTGVFP